MFEARNTQGSIVATAFTTTLGFVGKGQVTLTNDSYNTSAASANVQAAQQQRFRVQGSRFSDAIVPGGEQLVAFRSLNNTYVGIGYNENGSRCFVGRVNPNNPGDDTLPRVEYFIFGKAARRDHGIGIEMYNPDSSVAMTDALKPMKIAAISAMDTQLPAVTSSVAGSYAICYGVPIPRIDTSAQYDNGSGQFYYTELAGLYDSPNANGFSSAGFYPSQIRRTFGTPPFPNDQQLRMTALLIDVAGL